MTHLMEQDENPLQQGDFYTTPSCGTKKMPDRQHRPPRALGINYLLQEKHHLTEANARDATEQTDATITSKEEQGDTVKR